MCGIAGIYLKNKRLKLKDNAIEDFCDALLLEIENRGKHATGYVSVGWDGKPQLDKAAIPASEFVKEREPFQDDVQAVLLHTRFKTKGTYEVMGNNHPVTYNSCFAIHNGSIWNDDELFKDEELKRNFEVDSEIIPAVLDKYGLDTPDTIRTALEKLGGGMAIAALDPVKHKGKLLLAKGKDSPLYVFENDNVIVWASTHAAIKDTWGSLVGTPPKGDKIKWIAEGKFFLADDYQALGEYDFNPKARPGRVFGFGDRQQSRRVARGGHQRHQHVIIRPWDSTGPFNSDKDFRKALAEFRKDPPEDFAIARRWDIRDTYDDKKDFTDCNGVLQWPTCMCGKVVLKQDMRTHAKYGLICKDCYEVTAIEWKKQFRNVEGNSDDPEIPDIPLVDRRNLESWVQTESRIHRNVISDISDSTGLSQHALDFLLFRTRKGNQHEYGAGMTRLKFALLKLYDSTFDELTMLHWSDIQQEVENSRGITTEIAQEQANQQMYPWSAFSEQVLGGPKRVMYTCEDHGDTFPFGEHCYSCVWMGEEDVDEGDACGVEIVKRDEDNVHPLTSGLSKCGNCSGWMYNVCVPCAKKGVPQSVLNERQYELSEEVILNVTEIGCCCKTTRDRKCKKKLKLVVENSLVGKQLGYCTQHWNKCCSSSKCGITANFTGLTGGRYCHTHSRNRSGISDAAAAQDGTTAIIMEVK